MGTNITFNGLPYTIPAEGESNWGDPVSNYLIAIASGTLQKSGGVFSLTAELDLGSTYGLKSAYYKSRATNPASTGVIRLGNAEGISWRNAANTADAILKFNSDDDLEFAGSMRIGNVGTEGAGINIAGTTYNSVFKASDIGSSNSAQVILHRHSTTVPSSLYGSLSNSDTTSHVDVVNDQPIFDIYGVGYAGLNYKLFSQIRLKVSASGSIGNTSAPGAIEFLTTPEGATNPILQLSIDGGSQTTKVIGTLISDFFGGTNFPVDSALVTAGGNFQSSVTTKTELSYVHGVTSAIQTQLDAKEPTITTLPIAKGGTNSGTALNNNRIMQSTAGAIKEAAAITAARVLISDTNGIPTHSTVTNTTLGFLDATSSIQTQLNGKQASGSYALTTGNLSQFAATTSSQLAGVISDETGTGSLVFGTSPTLTTPSTDILTLDGQASAPASPAAGFYKAYVSDTTQKLTILDSAGVETTVGSGSGAENFITATDGTTLTGWSTYKDAAGVLPVDGTGGAATHITFTSTATTPLSGSKSFLITNSGSTSAQGEGASYDFTVGLKDKAKVLQISFDYIVNSGTFVAGSTGVDSDVEVYIYDVTNAVVIQPSSYKLLSNSTSIADKFNGTFQTSSNSTSYRLIFHCPTTATSAWSLKVDNIAVSPSQYVYGTPITDWKSYVPTFTNISAGSTGAGQYQWRRVGDSMEITGLILAGGTGISISGNVTTSIPSGFTIDSSKISLNNDSNIGVGNLLAPSLNRWPLAISTITSNTFSFIVNGGSTGAGGNFLGTSTPLASTTYWISSSVISWSIRVPILGWSSSVQMSDSSADTRVITAKVNNATATLTTTASKVTYTTVSIDDAGGYATGTYTVRVPGKYKVNASLLVARTATASGNSIQLFVVKTGANQGVNLLRDLSTEAQSRTITVSDIVDCKTGDTIEIFASAEGTSPTVVSDANRNFVVIERISGPSAIAATETVAASYWLSANFTASATVPVNFDSREFDTHGAVTTSATAWKFTAPISGLYSVQTYLQQNSAATGNLPITLFKNGSVYKMVGWQNGTVTGSFNGTNLRLNAGDFIDIRPAGSIVFIGGALSTAFVANIEITRIGN